MRKIRNTIRISLLAIAVTACSEEADNSPALTGDVELRVMPQVTGTIETRAAVADNTFGSGMQVGLGIKASGKTLDSMYDNFYTTYTGTVWHYYLNNVNLGSKLSGFSNWGTVTVMGYYPYSATVTDFSAIPFCIADADGVTTKEEAVVDYMVAATKQRTMTTGNQDVITLQFEHLMTYLYLYLNRPYQGPTLILSEVTLEIDNNRAFIVAGTFNAANPIMTDIPALITPKITTNRLAIATNHAISPATGSYTTIPLVIMPQLTIADGADATVTVTLYFTNVDGTPFLFNDQGNPKMSFALSSVSSNAGFLRGRQYQLRATVGTYVHFDGAPVVDFRELGDATESDEHIDI